MKKNLWLVMAGLMLVASLVLFSQTASQFPELDKNGKPVLPRPMPHVVYSPADLGHSAVVLPAGVGSLTPNTAVIRVGDVTKMTVFANCNQNFDLIMNVYTADDQAQPSPNFALYASYPVATGITAGPQQVYIASELAPNTTVSAATIATTVRLPQLAVSFAERNATATAGVCTDRVIIGY